MTRHRALVLPAALVVAAMTFYNPAFAAQTPKPGTLAALTLSAKPETAPPLTLVGGVGMTKTLASYRGRYVLLNLWASWCGPCVRELPALARLQKALPKDRFAVVTVDAEHNATPATAAKFLASHGVKDLPPFADGDLKVNLALHVYGMPTTVLIDPKGNIAARAVGPAEWDAPASVAYFKALAEAVKT